MGFTWINNDVATPSITIYDSNFTLNKIACQYFDDVRFVLLGYDSQKDQLAFKPVTKEEVESNIYPEVELHKISIGKSYGRISNKQFISQIAERYDFNFLTQKGYKYEAKFDYNDHILVVQL